MNRSSNGRKASARAEKIRVLIADDHTTFLAGLTSIIDMERDMIVIAQATDGRQAADAELRVAHRATRPYGPPPSGE